MVYLQLANRGDRLQIQAANENILIKQMQTTQKEWELGTGPATPHYETQICQTLQITAERQFRVTYE
jgi:hypothetical protein